MEIKICTIETYKGREAVVWDPEYHCLIAGTDRTDYNPATLEDAVNTARELWSDKVWVMKFTEYCVKPEFFNLWGEDTNEDTLLTALDIANICRGWEVDPCTVMYQLEEAPTLKYYVTIDDDRWNLYTKALRTLVNYGSCSEIGIEDEDPEYTNKLDDYLWNTYGILPEEWEVN